MSTASSPTPCLSVHNVKPRAVFIFCLNCSSASWSVSGSVMPLLYSLFSHVVFSVVTHVFHQAKLLWLLMLSSSEFSSSVVHEYLQPVAWLLSLFFTLSLLPTVSSIGWHICSISRRIVCCSCWTSTLCPMSSSHCRRYNRL